MSETIIVYENGVKRRKEVKPVVSTYDFVVKEHGKSLVQDSKIAQIHAPRSDDQDLSGLQPKEEGKGLSTNDLTNALKSTYDAAWNHSQQTHAPNDAQKNSDITKAEIENVLDGEVTSHYHPGSISAHESAFNHNNFNTAYSHSQAAHAPANAQANADITKAEIEAKLTGAITSHSHAAVSPFTILTVNGDKATAANTTPVTLGISFDYEANKTYVLDFYMLVAPTANTTGCGFLIDVSSTVTYVGSFNVHQLAATGTVSGGGSIGDLGATSQGVSSGMVGTGNNFVMGSAILITGANTGTATIYFRSETTAVTTCKSGSVVRIQKVN